MQGHLLKSLLFFLLAVKAVFSLSFSELPLPVQQEIKMDIQTAFPGAIDELSFSSLVGNSGSPTYKVSYKQKAYVLKKANLQDILILHRADEGGVGPKLFYPTAEIKNSRISLCDFVEGETLNFITFEKHKKEICRQLRQLHALEVTGLPEAKNLFQEVQGQLKGLNLPVDFKACLAQLPAIEKQLTDLSFMPKFIHDDLHPGNVIAEKTGKILFIDWDDAGKGDPFSDLARLSADSGLTQAEATEFLKQYLQKAPEQNQILRFTLLRKVAFVHQAASNLQRLKEGGWNYSPPEVVPSYDQVRIDYQAGTFSLNSEKGWSTAVKMALHAFEDEKMP
jgi:thiamine kinase-like enzyme